MKSQPILLQVPQNQLIQQQLLNNLALLLQQQVQQQYVASPATSQQFFPSPLHYMPSPPSLQLFGMPLPNLNTPSPILGRVVSEFA
jgi:hypothetical protein